MNDSPPSPPSRRWRRDRAGRSSLPPTRSGWPATGSSTRGEWTDQAHGANSRAAWCSPKANRLVERSRSRPGPAGRRTRTRCKGRCATVRELHRASARRWDRSAERAEAGGQRAIERADLAGRPTSRTSASSTRPDQLRGTPGTVTMVGRAGPPGGPTRAGGPGGVEGSSVPPPATRSRWSGRADAPVTGYGPAGGLMGEAGCTATGRAGRRWRRRPRGARGATAPSAGRAAHVLDATGAPPVAGLGPQRRSVRSASGRRSTWARVRGGSSSHEQGGGLVELRGAEPAAASWSGRTVSSAAVVAEAELDRGRERSRS